jgi:hypothetical protein
MTTFPFGLSREPVERSKAMSEWAQGFDKPVLSEVDGLSPNGG